MRNLILISIAIAAVAACGRKAAPTEPNCYAVVSETLFVEPGHRIGAFVIERRCGDFVLHSRH